MPYEISSVNLSKGNISCFKKSSEKFFILNPFIFSILRTSLKPQDKNISSVLDDHEDCELFRGVKKIVFFDILFLSNSA